MIWLQQTKCSSYSLPEIKEDLWKESREREVSRTDVNKMTDLHICSVNKLTLAWGFQNEVVRDVIVPFLGFLKNSDNRT